MQIEVDDEQMGCVEEYASTVGLTTTECLNMILDEWIRVTARTITVSQIEKSPVLVMPETHFLRMN